MLAKPFVYSNEFISGFGYALTDSVIPYSLSKNAGLWHYASLLVDVEEGALKHLRKLARELRAGRGALFQVRPRRLGERLAAAVERTVAAAEDAMRRARPDSRGARFAGERSRDIQRTLLNAVSPEAARAIARDPARREEIRSSVVEAVRKLADAAERAASRAREVIENIPRGAVDLPVSAPSPRPPPPPSIPLRRKLPTVALRFPITERSARRAVRELATAVAEAMERMVPAVVSTLRLAPAGRREVSRLSRELSRLGGHVRRTRALNRGTRFAPTLRSIPVLRVDTVYGPTYISPIDGTVWYTLGDYIRHHEVYYGGRY